MDWLDLLEVQGTLNILFKYHSSKASVLWHSAFFIVQFSHPYMTAGKTIALTRQTFVGTHIHTHIYNGMLLNHKKELNFTICNNMDKPGGYYAK